MDSLLEIEVQKSKLKLKTLLRIFARCIFFRRFLVGFYHCFVTSNIVFIGRDCLRFARRFAANDGKNAGEKKKGYEFVHQHPQENEGKEIGKL
jgi:hypothetical protein